MANIGNDTFAVAHLAVVLMTTIASTVAHPVTGMTCGIKSPRAVTAIAAL